MVVISVYTYGVKIIKKFRWESGFSLGGSMEPPLCTNGSTGYLMQLSVKVLVSVCRFPIHFHFEGTIQGDTLAYHGKEGLSEKLRRAFKTAGVSTTFIQPANMLKRALVASKDKTEQSKQSGFVYDITCSDCNAVYIGDSVRKLEKRLRVHKSTAGSSKSATREHVIKSKGHQID